MAKVRSLMVAAMQSEDATVQKVVYDVVTALRGPDVGYDSPLNTMFKAGGTQAVRDFVFEYDGRLVSDTKSAEFGRMIGSVKTRLAGELPPGELHFLRHLLDGLKGVVALTQLDEDGEFEDLY